MSTWCSLYVDVVFKEGLVGGEPSSPVRFRLKLRRAEIVAIVPDGEPAKIDPKSVSRDFPNVVVKLTSSEKVTTKTGKGARVRATLGSSALAGSVAGEIAAQRHKETESAAAVSQDTAAITVLHSLTADGDHSWEVRSPIGAALSGRPWDANRMPRLTIVDTRANRDKGIPASIRVEIRCRREDLIIEDIKVKDEDLWAKISRRAGNNNRRAAAESAIRSRLADVGLFHGELGDPFVRLTLAAVTAEPLRHE